MVRYRGLVALVLAVLLVLTGCAGSRVAKEREARNRGAAVGTGGMVAQLNLPGRVGRVDRRPDQLQPVRAEAADQDLAVRAADGPEQPGLRGPALAGHRLQVAGRQQADFRDPAGREVDRRVGLHGQRRGLHLQPDEEVPRDRRRRDLEGHPRRPGNRDHRERQPGGVRLRRRRRLQVHDHHRPADPAGEGLRVGRRPGEVRGQGAGVDGAVTRWAATTVAGSSWSAGPTTGRPTRSRSRSWCWRATTTPTRPPSSCAAAGWTSTAASCPTRRRPSSRPTRRTTTSGTRPTASPCWRPT